MLNAQFTYYNHDVHLEVDLQMGHHILGLLGPSGSGKTSLLKNLVGLFKPQSGQIILGNQILFDAQQKINLAMYQRGIALVFQGGQVFPHLNVRQNLNYAQRWSSRSVNAVDFDDIVRLLELQPLLDRHAQHLSGGQAQRVCLARALLSAPKLLLLDEPLTGLDLRLKQQILALLKQIHQQLHLPMIYVTHHLEEAQFLDAQLLQLQNNRLYKL